MLTIGLVGCGNWGALILRDLVELGCSVWSTARSPASAAKAAAGGAAGVVACIQELPASCDGYVVATPVSVHAGNVIELLPRQRPIFVEKPLTDDLGQAMAIERAGPDRVFVMDKWRYHAGINLLREEVRSGSHGRLIALRSRRVGWGHPHQLTDAVWTLLPHDLSIQLHVLGAAAQPLAAFAQCNAAGAAIGMSCFARLGAVSVACEVSVGSPVRDRSVQLSFAEATLVLPDAMSDHLLVHEGQGSDPALRAPARRIPFAVNMPLMEELRSFCRHLRGGPAPLSPVADGVSVVRDVTRFRQLAGLA